MGEPKKQIGRPFQKGQSGNPSGRKPIDPEVRNAAHLTKEKLITILNEFINLDREQIALKLQDPKATMLELAVGHIIAKAAKDGDTLRLNFLFDRIVGKVTDVVQSTNVNIGIDHAEYEEIPREALVKLVSGDGE